MIKMTALKRFRMSDGDGFRWIDDGEEYAVDAKAADFHEATRRGKRKAEPKSKKETD